MSQTFAPPTRPPAPKGALPAWVKMSVVWREERGGELLPHDHERPIDADTWLPVGVWWMCPVDDCKVGDWVFPDRETGEAGSPKNPGCPKHVTRLLPGRADPTDGNPKEAARANLNRRLAQLTEDARRRAAAAAAARVEVIRAASRAEAQRVASDLREHVPSAAVSAGALVGGYVALEQLGPLQTYALGAGLVVGGTVLAYVAVYVGELVYAWRSGLKLSELTRAHRRRARSHARWAASGVLGAGVWLIIAETLGADISNLRGVLMTMLGAVMAGVVNFGPWKEMVDRRKAAARAERERLEELARAEERHQAEERARQRREREEAEARQREAEEAALREATRIVATEDDRLTAGKKFAERWEKIATEARARNFGPGFEIWRTSVVVDQTRKLTCPDENGDEVVVAWEFLIRAEPGVLAPRSSSEHSPFVGMQKWLASMLEIDASMVELTYQPADTAGQGKPLINHGLVTLSETFSLGTPVRHPGPSGVYVDDKGVRWGFAGRNLRGGDVYRRLWTPGQPGGAGRYGLTGSGKSVVTQVNALNDLYAGIFPILHDPKRIDFADFYGIFPIGHTNEHRDVIRESLYAEMLRRQAWISLRQAEGLGGMRVAADPTWDPVAGGPPILVTWEEFHIHMKNPRFVLLLAELIRLQRATAIMAELATQGTGLTDTGDNNLREQINEICLQLMRMTDHTAGLAGYRGGYKVSSLPRVPGMMIMVDGQNDPVPYRSAFIPRDPQNPESLIYRLRQPDGTPEGRQILFAPELPPETIEVFRRHGLIDLWELGKTESGRQRLLSEADPVESTAYPDSLAAVLNDGAGPTEKPELRADRVILALLKHEADAGRPGLTAQEIQNSPWWGKVDGEWSKTDSGVPAHTTIGRACNRMATVTDQQAALGGEPLVLGDTTCTPVQWSILPAGYERAEQALTVLRDHGVLGPREQKMARAGETDVRLAEQRLLAEAEQEQLLRQIVAEAAASLGK